MHYGKDFGINCRIARFHNIYGPYGTWKGGREKAPAAFCRKVITRYLVMILLVLPALKCSVKLLSIKLYVSLNAADN